MRKIDGYELWIGHARSVPDGLELRRRGIAAVVDVAMDESPRQYGREMLACRFPLVDGGGNLPGVVGAAVTALAGLVQTRVPTVVYCSMGLSRSPSVAAGAIALVSGRNPDECLADVTRGVPADVSSAMWGEVVRAVHASRSLATLGLGPFGPRGPAT